MEYVRASDVEMSENIGELTVSQDEQGNDTYDFGSRAVMVHEIKNSLNLAETEPLPSPWTVEIEPTLLCNARCHFCSYEQDIEAFKQERMALPMANRSFGLSKETVFSVLDDLEEAGTTKGIFWSGGGDPLMWPHIVDAIKYAGKFAQNSLQTNAIGMGKLLKDTEAMRSIDLLTVSVYADSADLHREIAGVNSFEKVVENMRRTVAMRDQEGLDMTISAKVMVDANNYHRLPQIVAFYRALGVNAVGLREVQDYNYGGEGQRPVSVELNEDQKREAARIIKESSFKDPSLNAFARAMTRQQSKPRITSHCFNATDGHFACIDARGSVFTGNPEIGDERFSIGNVHEQQWREIWKGERHMQVVRDMDSAQKLGICASALCRHVRANVGVDDALASQSGPVDREAVMRNLGAFL